MMRSNRRRPIAVLAIAGLLVVSGAGAATAAPDDGEASFRALYKELVEIDTTLSPQIMEPVKKVAADLWPGVPIIPTMSAGATDGRFLNAAGIPTYGLSGMFSDAAGSRAHGLNERIRVQSLLDGRRFLYEVVRLYAQQPD